MKPLASVKSGKICRRCNKKTSEDMICPVCKNELVALYDDKLSWRTAYEVEKVSRRALLYTRESSEEDLY